VELLNREALIAWPHIGRLRCKAETYAKPKVLLLFNTVFADHRADLTGYTTVDFENGRAADRSSVVDYSRVFRNRPADEVVLLPDGSALVEMMSDYVVLREQARACLS